ncbi:MAG TPA: carboxylating nicotinate-nucleotide diphosphorylase [Planctomycetaceae bacterium]|nr:carboxylating nicotinate-nucleotide diphosphorylase [Planctomycetaceae bacterium]
MTVEDSFQTREQAAAATLVYLGLSEDLGAGGDLTCAALIDHRKRATVNVVARKDGVLAGAPIGRMVFAQLDPSITWTARKMDGDTLHPGDVIAAVSGPLDQLLIGERTMLNFLTHLSGIATLTRRFVDAVAGTNAQILDTRKTLPGYRVLEKYAVRCGGGTNHRLGLYDGVLIKDNHLAAWTKSTSIAAAVRTARAKSPPGVSIEVEVDTLDQLRDALAGAPDIVLLDNMDAATLREAVAIRDAHLFSPPSPDGGAMGETTSIEALAPPSGDRGLNRVLLEASGGVTLDTVRAIALTGVERISIGALTHSAPALDLAFDWSAAQ